jgi:sugar phosphate isomerase/epimerase
MIFSKGLFLHISSDSRREWIKNIHFIKSFAGVDHIEIWLENVHLQLNDIYWIKKELSDYSLIVHAPFMNLSIISNHEEIRNASINILKKAIEQSIILDAKLITIHAGTHSFLLRKKEVRQICTESFTELEKYSQNKILIALENLSINKGIQISYPVHLSEMAALKKNIPNINYTLDIGHSVHCNDNFASFLMKNMAHVKNIHLHNATIGKNLHFGLNKQGDLKLDNFLKLLSKVEYNGFLSLEIIGREDIKESWKLLSKKYYN